MEFFDAVVGHEVALWDAVERELQSAGQVGLGRLHALRVVDRRAGQARVQDLSDDIGITVGAASKLVDRLERDGLVTRTPNPANRRSSLLVLTPAGDRTLRAGTVVLEETLAHVLGAEDLRLVTETLQRLHRRLPGSATGAAA